MPKSRREGKGQMNLSFERLMDIVIARRIREDNGFVGDTEIIKRDCLAIFKALNKRRPHAKHPNI